MVSWWAEGLYKSQDLEYHYFWTESCKATLVISENKNMELEICKVVSIHAGILFHLSFLFKNKQTVFIQQGYLL